MLADELRIEITVCHVPPGTSSRQIEHRLFSFITQKLARQAADQLSGHCPIDRQHHHRQRLTVACQLDENDYAKGTKVTDAEMAALNIQPAVFHGEWNYTIAQNGHG